MRRRNFTVTFGGLLALTTAARAQQTPTVGFLSSRSPAESRHLQAAFLKGLAETGFVEGRNLAVTYRWAEGRYEQLPSMAADLVGRNVAVIFTAGGPPAALAAKASTSTIPIVFSAANDPVGVGLVSNLARPGGNVTGMSTLTTGLATKGVELIKELVPGARVIAYLINPTNPSAPLVVPEVLQAARQIGVEVPIVRATTLNDLDTAFAAVAGMNAAGIVVYADPFFDSQRDRIVGLAARHALPASYAWRDYVVSGGLIAYGSSLPGSYRQAATYVGRILKGEKAGDLPVQQPSQFELVINLRTAKALGIDVPEPLQSRADELIE